ncbi:MAG: UDP-N-acetylmuramoyl-L-alanyl-D-glutamate--2,6-diaminopimelate ligase [Flavobacteriales bacterium]
MKTLKFLLKNIKTKAIIGSLNESVSGVEIDSRACTEQSLFVATKGAEVDGHRYIDSAINNGASAVLCETMPEHPIENITYIRVSNSRKALAHLASAFYDYPSRELKLIGVTGTNGKTTSCTLLFELLRSMDLNVGLLSTVNHRINDTLIPSTHTTPNPLIINKLMREMRNQSCDYCFMEVSSHGLDQDRVVGLDFDVAVFNNISRDHLDYHHDFNTYLAAKKRLFDQLKPEALALSNVDDRHSESMVSTCKAEIQTFALNQPADIKAKILESDLNGSLIQLNQHQLFVRLIGKFNVYNASVCYAVAKHLGFDELDILTKLSTLQTATGRFEQIRSKSGKLAIVDYSHTPDALENILKTLKNILPKSSKLITVVGCGGDRDKGKRPEMANIACQYSDQSIFTSDNPRTEDPNAILKDMEAGVPQHKTHAVLQIENRQAAIRTALQLAQDSDVVLVAGKGHEDYQIIGTERHHFSDKEEIESFFNLMP